MSASFSTRRGLGKLRSSNRRSSQSAGHQSSADSRISISPTYGGVEGSRLSDGSQAALPTGVLNTAVAAVAIASKHRGLSGRDRRRESKRQFGDRQAPLPPKLLLGIDIPNPYASIFALAPALPVQSVEGVTAQLPGSSTSESCTDTGPSRSSLDYEGIQVPLQPSLSSSPFENPGIALSGVASTPPTCVSDLVSPASTIDGLPAGGDTVLADAKIVVVALNEIASSELLPTDVAGRIESQSTDRTSGTRCDHVSRVYRLPFDQKIFHHSVSSRGC